MEVEYDDMKLNNEQVAVTFPVSFCIIASVKDFRTDFQRCVESLPINSEVCVLLNRTGETDKLTDVEYQFVNGRKIVIREWVHTDFSFAKARNLCHDIATNDWVMWIDCDEVLAEAQHEGIGDIPALMQGGVGGIMCGQASMTHTNKVLSGGTDDDIEYHNIMQCRIYRRSTGALWEGRCHEQIAQSIQDAGYSVRHSTITVIHNGYSVDKVSLQNKLRRNVKLLTLEMAERGYNDSTLSKYYAVVLSRELSAYIKHGLHESQ